jgi:flavin-binding protein dodecin
MAGTYKLIEIVGISKDSYEDAIANAIASASRTLEGLAWFEVVEQRGSISEGKPDEFQVKVKIAFKIVED